MSDLNVNYKTRQVFRRNTGERNKTDVRQRNLRHNIKAHTKRT